MITRSILAEGSQFLIRRRVGVNSTNRSSPSPKRGKRTKGSSISLSWAIDTEQEQQQQEEAEEEEEKKIDHQHLKLQIPNTIIIIIWRLMIVKDQLFVIFIPVAHSFSKTTSWPGARCSSMILSETTPKNNSSSSKEIPLSNDPKAPVAAADRVQWARGRPDDDDDLQHVFSRTLTFEFNNNNKKFGASNNHSWDIQLSSHNSPQAPATAFNIHRTFQAPQGDLAWPPPTTTSPDNSFQPKILYPRIRTLRWRAGLHYIIIIIITNTKRRSRLVSTVLLPRIWSLLLRADWGYLLRLSIVGRRIDPAVTHSKKKRDKDAHRRTAKNKRVWQSLSDKTRSYCTALVGQNGLQQEAVAGGKR